MVGKWQYKLRTVEAQVGVNVYICIASVQA